MIAAVKMVVEKALIEDVIKVHSSSSLLLSSLEWSDTAIHEPCILALLEIAPHFCYAGINCTARYSPQFENSPSEPSWHKSDLQT